MTSLRVSALTVRAAILLLAAVAAALVPHPGPGLVVVGTAAAVLAVAAPAAGGGVVLLLTLLVGWILAYGHGGVPAPARTVAFAVAAYLLHATITLAANVPVTADVAGAVVRGWAARCLPGIAAALVAGAVVAALGRVPGSSVLDAVGLAAVIAVLAAAAWVSRTLDRRDAS